MRRRSFVGLTLGTLVAPFVARRAALREPLDVQKDASWEKSEARWAEQADTCVYAPLEGGSYRPGEQFSISRRRTVTLRKG